MKVDKDIQKKSKKQKELKPATRREEETGNMPRDTATWKEKNKSLSRNWKVREKLKEKMLRQDENNIEKKETK